MIASPNNSPLERFTDFDRKTLLPPVWKEHANYRLDMEVLCRIPLQPTRLPVHTLGYDLDVTDEMIRAAINRLRGKGYRIQSWPIEKGLAVGMSIVTWDKALEVGEAYFEDVYGSWGCSAVAVPKKGDTSNDA